MDELTLYFINLKQNIINKYKNDDVLYTTYYDTKFLQIFLNKT